MLCLRDFLFAGILFETQSYGHLRLLSYDDQGFISIKIKQFIKRCGFSKLLTVVIIPNDCVQSKLTQKTESYTVQICKALTVQYNMAW